MPHRIQRSPFTVYDILGYFVPGLYLVIYTTMFFFGDTIQEFINTDSVNIRSVIIFSILFLIESFVIGHVISLVSAETIERLCIGFFGYPSETLFLDNKNPSDIRKYVESKIDNYRKDTLILKIILMVILLPYVLFLRFISMTRLSSLVIKPLGQHAQSRIKSNYIACFGQNIDEVTPSDKFRMIDFYVYCKDSPVRARQYNYVTIYGFCRNMSLAVYVVCLFDAIAYLSGLSNSFYKLSTIGLEFWINLIISQTLLLGYLKFLRRYSQESLMAFAVGDLASSGDEGSASGGEGLD